MRKERKHYTAEEKVAILRRHLLDKVPVSDLCEELGLQPTVFYRWQKEFFENGAAAFQTTGRPRRQAEEKHQMRLAVLIYHEGTHVIRGVEHRRRDKNSNPASFS